MLCVPVLCLYAVLYTINFRHNNRAALYGIYKAALFFFRGIIWVYSRGVLFFKSSDATIIPSIIVQNSTKK